MGCETSRRSFLRPVISVPACVVRILVVGERGRVPASVVPALAPVAVHLSSSPCSPRRRDWFRSCRTWFPVRCHGLIDLARNISSFPAGTIFSAVVGRESGPERRWRVGAGRWCRRRRGNCGPVTTWRPGPARPSRCGRRCPRPRAVVAMEPLSPARGACAQWMLMTHCVAQGSDPKPSFQLQTLVRSIHLVPQRIPHGSTSVLSGAEAR